MSDSKGISLRKAKRSKKPTISSPKQISGPINPSSNLPRSSEGKSFETAPQRPQAVGGKTSDLVKRRYSTRFNNLPTDFDPTAPPIPSVPSLPNQYASTRDRQQGTSPVRGAGLKVDEQALMSPELKPDQYVTGLLTDASEHDIGAYQAELRKVKNRASTNLQQNIYQNRTQFIKISKEAEKLKGEMRALRNLMAELKTNTTSLRTSSHDSSNDPSGFDTGIPSTLSKRDKRSSVADRTALWNSQLQALWKAVEGSQKFLPAAPGRHVIQNAGSWAELDKATWKSKRPMQIILLNDHILIGSRKKRRGDAKNDQRQGEVKIFAERCWPLLEIEIVDLAGTSDSTTSQTKVANAIMIRGVGQESFTYLADNPDHKPSLLINFKKAVEHLRKGLQSEMESSNKAKETINYFASRDPGLLKKTDLLDTLSDVKDMLIEVDGNQQNLRWVEGQVDELDIDIALQKFDEAVVRVEELGTIAKGLKSNVVAQDFIAFKAEERATRLATLITRELVGTHNNLKKTKRSVNLLARLGFEDRAREAYLEARGDLIDRRTRQCVFEGNLHQYIWEVSFVYFTVIKNTVSIFQACFPPLLMSACVKWAKEQVDTFNIILGRQLSSVDRGGPDWTKCMKQAKDHARLLSEVGLDFNSLIGREVLLARPEQGPVGLGLA